MEVFIHDIDATVTLEEGEISMLAALEAMSKDDMMEVLQDCYSYLQSVDEVGPEGCFDITIRITPPDISDAQDDLIELCAHKLTELGLGHDLCSKIKDVTDEGNNTFRIKTRVRS